MKKDWEYKTLKEACIQLFAGGDVPKPYISKTKTKEFSVPIYSNGVENEGLYGYTNSAKIKEQAVTISARGTIGATFRRYEPFFPAIRLITAVPNKEILSIDYLFYALKILTIGNSGTSIPQLTIPNIKNISIPIPPLPEQKEIVEYLDSSFAKIDKLKENAAKNLEEAKALFQSALKDALEPKEGWEEKTLGEVAKICGGKRLPKGCKLQSEPTNHKYIRVADFLDNGTVCKDEIQYITDDIFNQIKRYTISSDDVYISIAGTIGKSGIVPDELNGANLTENACKLVLNKEQDKRFIYFVTISPFFKEQINILTKKSAQPKLALTRLATANVPIPPLSEQQSIVSFLDSLNEKVNTLQQNYSRICDECDALKQAILRQVFE